MQKAPWYIILFLVMFFYAPSGMAKETSVGSLEVESGTAILTRGETTIRVTSGKTSEIFQKDVVQTLGNSAAKLLLGKEGSKDQFLLAEKTTFVIEEYLVQEKKPTRGLFNLLGGKIRSIVNSIKEKKEIKVKTSTATIGVKGTDFLTEVPNNQMTRVTTFEGLVSMENRLGSLVEEVMIAPGTSSSVIAGNAPFSPLNLSKESLLESSQIIARGAKNVDPKLKNAGSSETLSRDNLQNFRQQQFNSMVEQAARLKGSILNIQIEFPQG